LLRQADSAESAWHLQDDARQPDIESRSQFDCHRHQAIAVILPAPIAAVMR
jgi:hypothetical protein